MENIGKLTLTAQAIQDALNAQGIGGETGPIDHIEIFGPPGTEGGNSRSFVLCPGGAYDRSPCGTGTSAKLACLAADGKLAPDTDWVQESIIGSRFTGRYRNGEKGVIPSITVALLLQARPCSSRTPLTLSGTASALPERATCCTIPLESSRLFPSSRSRT